MPTYKAYIKSEAWAKRRREYYETHERKCRACGSSRNMNLHHKTYRRLGNERDADLVALCRKCHNNIHIQARSEGRNLWIVTEEFIRNKKRRIKRSRTAKRVSQTTRKKNGIRRSR